MVNETSFPSDIVTVSSAMSNIDPSNRITSEAPKKKRKRRKRNRKTKIIEVKPANVNLIDPLSCPKYMENMSNNGIMIPNHPVTEVRDSVKAFEENEKKMGELFDKAVTDLVHDSNATISYNYILWPVLGSLGIVAVIAVGISAIPQHDVIKVIQRTLELLTKLYIISYN